MKNKINYSAFFSYFLVFICLIIIIIAGISAYGGTNPPVMGHSFNEMQFSAGTSVGQALIWDGSSLAKSSSSLAISDSRLSVNSQGKLCYTAPVPTCTLTQQTCSNFTFVHDFYYYNCASTAPATLSAYCLNNICNGKASSYYQLPCTGDTTSCSGGTSIPYYEKVTSAYCAGVHKLVCYCRTDKTYLQEGYSPAGEVRCF